MSTTWPLQFPLQIGYLCHLKDPRGFSIELLQTTFHKREVRIKILVLSNVHHILTKVHHMSTICQPYFHNMSFIWPSASGWLQPGPGSHHIYTICHYCHYCHHLSTMCSPYVHRLATTIIHLLSPGWPPASRWLHPGPGSHNRTGHCEEQGHKGIKTNK